MQNTPREFQIAQEQDGERSSRNKACTGVAREPCQRSGACRYGQPAQPLVFEIAAERVETDEEEKNEERLGERYPVKTEHAGG